VHLEVVGIGDPPLPKGASQLVLQLLAETLTPEEAEAIQQAVAEMRRIDWEIWEQTEGELEPVMRESWRGRLKGLYVITDPQLGGGHLTGARAALQGGARIIQLRDKAATTRQLIEYAQALRALTRDYDALLIINDRLDVAMAVGADGVHLGQDDMPVPLARRVAGDALIIGVSAETVEEAIRAESEGADYLGVGPMFATATKPDAGTPVGPERLRQIKQRVNIPVFGIGGITLENAEQVLQAGADGICVISAVLGAPDPTEAAHHFAQMLCRRCKRHDDPGEM